MPTAFYDSGFRFFFYSSDGLEPRHVHVEKGVGGETGKWWLEPTVRLARPTKLGTRDQNAVRKIILARRRELIDAWNTHFGA